MSRKEFMKLLEFICSVGGVEYYERLYDRLSKNECNMSDDENFNELQYIAHLFEIWMEEYTWSKEDELYMNSIINMTK